MLQFKEEFWYKIVGEGCNLFENRQWNHHLSQQTSQIVIFYRRFASIANIVRIKTCSSDANFILQSLTVPGVNLMKRQFRRGPNWWWRMVQHSDPLDNGNFHEILNKSNEHVSLIVSKCTRETYVRILYLLLSNYKREKKNKRDSSHFSYWRHIHVATDFRNGSCIF